MFDRGWDLLDYFRGVRPWSQLVRLVENLPPYSKYKLALSDDDEIQRWRERRFNGKTPPPRPPSLDSWTVEDEIMGVLHDGFSLLRNTIISVNLPKGKQAPKFKPAKRPVTAAERAERRRDRDIHESIVRKVRPDKFAD